MRHYKYEIPNIYSIQEEWDNQKQLPWRTAEPKYKGSSTKSGRSPKKIKKDRKRNKIRKS